MMLTINPQAFCRICL